MNEIVDAKVLAARGAELSRSFKIAELPRLREFAVQGDAHANLQARFQMVGNRCAIDGEVAAMLRAICQRCLQPVDLDIDDRFHVLLVNSEDEMNALPESQDSIIAKSEHLDLGWLAEEQLLLAMPLVPLHSDSDCVPVAETQIESNDRQTPFAQLRELMKKQ